MRILLSFILGLMFLVMVGCRTCDCSKQCVTTEPMQPQTDTASRNWSEQTVACSNVGVVHTPVYLRGHFYECFNEEQPGRNWNSDDAAALVLSPLSFGFRTVTLPIAAVMTPPWQSVTSRGGFPLESQE